MRPSRANLLSGRFKLRTTGTVINDDVRPAPGELQSTAFPDSPASSGDQCNFASQVHHGLSVPSLEKAAAQSFSIFDDGSEFSTMIQQLALLLVLTLLQNLWRTRRSSPRLCHAACRQLATRS